MTTNANKHGLRAAAAERSNRHAQRTPLPPKAGVVAEVREIIAEVEDLRRANVTRLRTIIAEMDLPSPGRAGKDQLIQLIEAERGKSVVSLDLGKTTGVAVQPATMAAPAMAGKSLGKAEAFAEKARAAKWQVSLNVEGDDAVELTAVRDGETLIQAWAGGVWSYPSSFYGYGDRNTKPRNASGALKLLARSPEDAQADASKVASNKHFRKAEPRDIGDRLEEAQRRLPFDPELAPDEIIQAALTGQAVVWYNTLRRGQESAIVSRKGARISVTPEGKRVVTFCCPATGYRSCYVSSILRVGRGKSSVTAGSATNSVTVEVE